MLNEVKARAMSKFRLTLSEINISEPNFEDINNSANPIVANNKKDLEQFLNDIFPPKNSKNFQKATTLLKKQQMEILKCRANIIYITRQKS